MVYYTGRPIEKGIWTARHDLITVLKPHFYRKDPKSYFIKAIDHTFYGFTGVINHLRSWENTPKACKSQAEPSGGE